MGGNDLTIYSEYAHEWWTPGAPRFRSLQNITPFRLSLIDEMVGPVAGKRVVDVGCGGGLISIPLLQRGADVTGLDLSAESIEVAKKQAAGAGRFFVGDATDLSVESESADIVLLADVVDHVPEYAKCLAEARRVLRPGGKLFVCTINRTWRSWFFALFLGENLGLVPKGTHAHHLFVKPDELVDAASRAGLRLTMIQGESPEILATILKWAVSFRKSTSRAVAYSAVFQK